MASIAQHPPALAAGIHPMHKAIYAALAKLDDMLDQAMGIGPDGTRQPIDDHAVATQKGRMLLELSRLPTPNEGPPIPPELAEKAHQVRARLADEQRLLKRRIEAADMISGLIAEAVMAEEWDGTYEPRGALTAPGPGRAEPRREPAGKAGKAAAYPSTGGRG